MFLRAPEQGKIDPSHEGHDGQVWGSDSPVSTETDGLDGGSKMDSKPPVPVLRSEAASSCEFQFLRHD
jgi:hypothetical protein